MPDTSLHSSHNPHIFRLIIAFLVFWIPTIIFAKIAGEILKREPIHLDITILNTIHSIASPALDMLFTIITTVGNVEVILPISLLLVGYLFYKKYRTSAITTLFAIGGAGLANLILKLLFHRDRPSLWHPAIVETGYSFPRGHAMLSSALAVTIILLLWQTKWRIPSIIIGALFVMVIVFSRLYLGVHYPTDIVAGWIVSFLWVNIVFFNTRHIRASYFKPKLA